MKRKRHSAEQIISNLRKAEIDGVHREALERQLAERLLDTLIGRAIFPRYAFPMDIVSFWVSKPKWRGDPAYKRTFEYAPQRDLQIALSEFAPGSSLTVDKWRFRAEAIYSPYSAEVTPTLEKAQSYAGRTTRAQLEVQEPPASRELGRQRSFSVSCRSAGQASDLLDKPGPRYALSARYFSRRGGRAVEGSGLESRFTRPRESAADSAGWGPLGTAGCKQI